MSFDEATVVGSDRYLTLNVHHAALIFGNSKVAPLGLIRVNERATGAYLSEVICARLHAMGLSTQNFVSATTDGASNVQRAVQLMGIRKQKCFVHGLDLVVKKTVYGRNAEASNMLIFLEAIAVENSDDTTDDVAEAVECSEVNNEDECETGAGTAVLLGDVVDRLRRTVREFKRSTNMMDEIRKLTLRDEYNSKKLKPILDCATRWYSTCLMIERALRILPALNNVLSRYGEPISAVDALALEKIATVLSPFKRAILLLCRNDSTLLIADKVFKLLLRDLQDVDSDLASMLRTNLRRELCKRRTVVSTVLAVLTIPKYNFEFERQIGQREPSTEEMMEVLKEIIGFDATPSPPSEDESCSVRKPSQSVKIPPHKSHYSRTHVGKAPATRIVVLTESLFSD